jgi:glycosyltransferase involved in cell wall biosynthesis
MRRVSRHSLDASEYGTPSERTPGVEPHIFIIGNHFDHKFVRRTADAVAAGFPDRKIVAVGYGEKTPAHDNIVKYESGNLTNEVFEKFYSDAELVVFPSHYEGFGFPILHSLARQRPIYVRDSALYRELADGIEGAENIHYFCTSADLVADIRNNGASWIGSGRAGEKGGWDRSAREVFDALEQARATVSYEGIVDRLRRLDDLVGSTTVAVPTFAKRVGRRVEFAIDKVLGVPGVKPLARRGLTVYRRLRRK